MMGAVHRYEGTVNKVLGDGIMALFGAPIAHEDHAVRACYAALAMRSALREISEKTRRDFGVEVQVRTGLHSGEVVVRTIGNDLTMDYDAIGQTTHLASRMEQLALPGSIRMTADTLRLAEGLVQVRPLGPIPVKGGAANQDEPPQREDRDAKAADAATRASQAGDACHPGPADLADRSRCPLDGDQRPWFRHRRLQRPDRRRGQPSS